MKKILKNKKRILSAVFAVLVCFLTAMGSFAAEDDFEKKIAAFPESYKPYLRQLHQAHPSWEFEPFFTGLDFNVSVDSECGAKSLVSSSSASELFKSKDIGDYNYSTNKYIEKDGGFVEANRLAVSYFMDPRNFLNEDGIFMFETLSFSDSFTVEAVENVLKGSFMANKKITYYDKDGELKKTSTKYSQAILNAGKKYNVNPCYLASKILNEVGSSGSSSVTGKHKTYPGIYNFYNIGATDGSGAIARGLAWAADTVQKTYGRPWTTPVKSINGGAEFLASSYIAKGQFTGYLQRFNVNPNGYYRPYDHQYMTNLTGALSQGYSTYVSYVKSGLIDNKYVFSIPVYENMPSWTDINGKGQLTDGFEQSGKITADVCFVRTGPSTYYSQLADVSGNTIRLGKGETVKIIDRVNTDSDYYLSLLQYPYWYKINFTLSGATYEGYVPAHFVDISTVVQVGIGEYAPSFITENSEIDMHLVSYDAKVAEITPDNKIRFLKSGTVTVGAYDSTGNFDKVKYVVTNGGFVIPSGVTLTNIKSTSVVLNFASSVYAANYEVIAVDGKGSVSHRAVTNSSPYTVNVYNSVPDNTYISKAQKNSDGTASVYWETPEKTDNKIYIRAVIEDTPTSKKYGPVICLSATSYIGGYEIYSYGTDGSYTKISSLAPTASSYTVPANQAATGRFAVRAFGNVQGENVYGKYSSVVDMKNIPADITGLALSDVKDGQYTLTWNTISGARYDLYKETNGSYALLKSFTSAKYKPTKQGNSAFSKYKMVAVKSVNGIVYEGNYTKEFTATTLPSKVKNFRITESDIGGKVKWNAVPNATGYDLYVYKDKKKKFAKLKTVTTNSYNLVGRTPAKEYRLRIVPRIRTTFGVFKGEPTELTFRTKPGKVTDVKAKTVKTTSLTFTWEKTKATSCYYIYQYNAKKKKYVKIATTKNTSYTATGLKAGTTYKYKIRSVKLHNGKTLCYNSSSVLNFTTKPDKVSRVKTSSLKKTQLTLSWSKVTGGEKYQIYRYNSDKKKYTRIATVEGKTKYKVTGLKAGKSYKFKIRALKTLNGKKYYGGYSDIFTVKTKK